MSGGHGGGHEVERLIPEIEAWEGTKKILKSFLDDGLFGAFFHVLDLLLGKESRSSEGHGGSH